MVAISKICRIYVVEKSIKSLLVNSIESINLQFNQNHSINELGN